MFPRILFPLAAILFIIFLYSAIIRSILPLYSLRIKVKEFANGNYDVDCKSEKEDEIGILSNEFDKSVKKIKSLRDSRQLFLRNIMHELKTPITKGKLSCAMLEDSPYLETLKNVFQRQEVLLNEFARIEKLSANEIALKKENYSLQDILDYSLDILNHEQESVTCKLKPMSLHVDFELFGTAIKNLLDNGINYSDDLHVTIESNETEIIISNLGKALEFPLDRYSEPYFLEGKKQKSSRGLGFGLFITTNIIKLHNMKIEYNREKDRNIFKIHAKKS
jgi:two-component system OmpR family sensor kinase